MNAKAIMTALLGATAATALAAPPALSASVTGERGASALSQLVGQFTPATGDPRLIERYARISAEAKRNFRFTPVVARTSDGSRAVTVVVRSRAQSLSQIETAARPPAQPRETTLAIAPVAYDLGKSVGYTKFTIPDAGTGVDLASLPKAKVPEGTTRRKSRFSTELKLDRDAAIDSTPRTLNPEDSVSVDVGAGYSLSRRLKVTAGVRYKQENDRLAPLADDRRDSQAVYVGTRFKF